MIFASPLRFALLTLLGCVVIFQVSSRTILADESRPTVEPRLVSTEDANLFGVTFIDVDRGWSVGQHGTILQTQDGGVNWKPQASGTSATLTSIAMYNSQRGLAVGGQTQAYSQCSLGEVVITMDGGKAWQVITGHDLPRLRKLIIGPNGQCVAAGDWSHVHLSSVFTSRDGGMNWTPQVSPMVGHAIGLAGTVDDYLVLSDQGEVIRFRQDAAPRVILPANQDWTCLAGTDNKRLLLGPRGAIRSDDHGTTWQLVSQTEELPLSVAPGQTASTTLFQDEAWITSDASLTIKRIQPAPAPNQSQIVAESIAHAADASIRSIFRFDADRGWAVGDFGLISVTRDGGKSWRTLRGGNRSPAVVAIGANAAALPWSLLASESLQHQRRVAVVVDRESAPVTATEQERVRDATVSLGPATTICSVTDRTRASELLALTRPAVVLLDQSLTPSQRALWSAVAAESGAKRVIEVGERGSQTTHVAAAIPAAGILGSDVWFDAIARIDPSYLPPTKLMLSTRFDMLNDSSAGDGLASSTRNDPRYTWARTSTASRRQLQVLQARTAEMTWIESLVTSSSSPEAFETQLNAVLPRMNDADRQRMFARLIALTAQRGQHSIYLSALESLTRSEAPAGSGATNGSRTHELQDVAGLRLSAIYASTEWQQTFGNLAVQARLRSDARTDRTAVQGTSNQPQTVDLAVHLSPFQSPVAGSASPPIGMGSPDRQVGKAFTESDASARGIQLVGGASAASKSTQNNPSSVQQAGATKPRAVDLRWEFHPAVLLAGRASENSVSASKQEAGSATTNLRRLAGLASAGPWGALAADVRLPETIFGTLAPSQPFLDGRFDESFWRGGQKLKIADNAATVQVAHDSRFVYFSIDAPALTNGSPANATRQRDTPLDGVDRYRIRLDVDRDLMTAYEFEFDAAGNTRDSCDGFLPFNPRWFIACVEADGRTRAEIAVQKSDLGADVAKSGAIMNLAFDRLDKRPANRGLAMPIAEQWRPVMME